MRSVALGAAFLNRAVFEFDLGDRIAHVLVATKAEIIPGLHEVEFVI
jgi:hypothetical protein